MKSQEIIKIVCEYFAINPDTLSKKGWTGEINRCRQLCMFFLLEMTMETQKTIGSYFDRDHATVIHAKKCVTNDIETNLKFAETVSEIRCLLNPDLPKHEDDVFMENDFFPDDNLKDNFQVTPFKRPFENHLFRKNYLTV